MVPYHEPEGPAGLPIGTRLRANAFFKCLFFTLCNGDTLSAGSLSDDDVPDIDNLVSASGLQLQRALAFVVQEYDDECFMTDPSTRPASKAAVAACGAVCSRRGRLPEHLAAQG